MIPPRMLSNQNEIFGTGNGLRNRVTACRKRVRSNRFHRAQPSVLPETRPLEGANDPAESTERLETASAVGGSRAEELKFEEIAGQEVGIT